VYLAVVMIDAAADAVAEYAEIEPMFVSRFSSISNRDWHFVWG